jgi:hypothetical protein
MKPEYPEKTTNHEQATGKRYHLRLRVECTLFCNLLKIEISSNGQNCSILSQNVPKFELFKHNDELFNI